MVADNGYNKPALLRRLQEKGYRTYIPNRRQGGKRHRRTKEDEKQQLRSTRPEIE